MVRRRKYDIPVPVEIEVSVGNLRKPLKTRPAQADRLQTIGGAGAKDSTRHSDFFAPARSLVEMTFRHTALVVATTDRTLFGPAQALKMWWRFQISGTSSSGPLGNRQP
jgi:hypothetical protein